MHCKIWCWDNFCLTYLYTVYINVLVVQSFSKGRGSKTRRVKFYGKKGQIEGDPRGEFSHTKVAVIFKTLPKDVGRDKYH